MNVKTRTRMENTLSLILFSAGILFVFSFSIGWAMRALTVNEMTGIRGGTNNPPVAVAEINDSTTVAYFALGETPAPECDGRGSYDPDTDELTYLWDLGNGDTVASSWFSYTGYSDTGAYTVVLTVTDPYDASDTDSMTVTVFKVEVTTATSTTMNITSTPAMPSVTFHADLKPESILSDTTFEWYLETSYTGHGRSDTHRLPATSPQTQDVEGNEDWIPTWGSLLVGGDVEVFVKASQTGSPTKAEHDKDGYEIKGTNPTQNQIFGTADDDEEKAVCWQESSHRQFSNTTNLPIFGPPDGWGLMQRDPLPSEAYIWDWDTNLSGGVDYLAGCHTSAQNYLNNWYVEDGGEGWSWDPRTENPDMVWDGAFSRYNTGNPLYSYNGNGGERNCTVNNPGCIYADLIRDHIDDPPW